MRKLMEQLKSLVNLRAEFLPSIGIEVDFHLRYKVAF